MRLDSVPCFRELLERRDLAMLDVLVYGALAEFEAREWPPSLTEIGLSIGRTSEYVRRVLRRLEAVGLIRRVLVPGAKNRYALLGPRHNVPRTNVA